MLARFGSWYELFPRSWGGFEGVRAQLPQLAELGFDVVYLPPIHPIGTHEPQGAEQRARRRARAIRARRGRSARSSAVTTRSIRSSARSTEFERLVADAKELGIEIALDFAIQCSPDHPWLKEHPEWFNRRPDGTLKYAENPPKKYQDIYNVNFDSRGLEGPLAGAARHRAPVGLARCHRLPRRQPAHEAGRRSGSG